MRRMRRLSLALVGLVCAWATPVRATDLLFHIVEVVQEHEIEPRTDDHVVRWEGDYYVGPDGVTVTGWGIKGARLAIPYDQPHHGHTPQGSPYVSLYHRLPNGLDLSVEYDSFVLTRHIVKTDPQTCTDDVSVDLKPGHQVFTDSRIRNGDQMPETSKVYLVHRCAVPKLTG